MEFLAFYALFALTTGIVGIIELLSPILKQHPKYEHPYILRFVFFIGTIICAPLMIVPCIVPTAGEAFRDSFDKAMFD